MSITSDSFDSNLDSSSGLQRGDGLLGEDAYDLRQGGRPGEHLPGGIAAQGLHASAAQRQLTQIGGGLAVEHRLAQIGTHLEELEDPHPAAIAGVAAIVASPGAVDGLALTL